MPRLEDIEKFKEILYTLGSEPQISARRAEAREDQVSAPGAQPPPGGVFGDETGGEGAEPSALDLDDLLGETTERPVSPAPTAPEEQPLEEAAFGFDEEPGSAVSAEGLDLGGLFDGAEGAEPAGEEPSGFEGVAEAAGGGFGELGEAGVETPGAEPLAEALTQPPLEHAQAPGEAPSAEEPQGPEGLGEIDFGDLGALPEVAPAEGPVEGEGPPPAGEEPTFPEMPSFEPTPETETQAAEPAAEGATAELSAEAFTLPAVTGEEAAVPAGGEETAEAEPPLETFGAEIEGFGEVEAEPTAEPAAEAGETTEAAGLEGEGFDLGGFEAEPLGEAAGESPGAESIDELGEGFSLQGLSDELGAPAAGEAPTEVPAEGEGEAAPPAGAIALEDREFRALQRNLDTLPRNLKIAIESVVGEQGYTGELLRPLLDQLIRGASPRDIAAQVGKITGTTIRIPARFERQTGAEFEAERGSLAYLIRTSVLPILRTVLLVAVVLGIMSYGGYTLVYKPLYAQSLYRAGYRALDQGEYAEAERSFAAGREQRRIKDWYFRYAVAYTEQRRYQDASRKYEAIIADFGYDKKAYLDHAALQSRKMGNYASAESLLGNITNRDFFDRDALLANGDNYLEWARHATATEGDTTREALLEKARLEYARVLERYGFKNDALFHMMRYFVRADRLDDLQDLRSTLEGEEKFSPDPDVYAEVGGYLLDKGLVEDARTVLLKAHAVSVKIPEIDYNLARLYHEIDERAEEGRALRNTLANLADAERTPEHILMEIDTRRRDGDWLYREEQMLEAADEYQKAIDLTEVALGGRILEPRAELGLAYAGLGNVRYYQDNDYDAALDLYLRSRQRGLEDPEVDFRIGYIRYAQGDYARAVAELVPLQERQPQNWNVLFATATALYQRGDYYAAQGYYLRLIDRLMAKRDAISDLEPETNPEHFTLANLLLKSYNNLGITYYQLGKMKGGRGREVTQALVEVTEAAQYLDMISRDPETLERSEAKNLAYLNANALQHPGSVFEPTIYDRIPRDTTAQRF